MMHTLVVQQQKKVKAGHRKAKVFVTLSLDERGNPRLLKMRVTSNIRQASVRKFTHAVFANGSEILSDDYCSYIPALENYAHEYHPTTLILAFSIGCTRD